MLLLLWPMLLNPVLWFSLDLPIFAGVIGVALLLSNTNPILAVVVALF